MVAEHAAVCVDTVTRKKRLTPPDGHARWSLRLLEKHVLLTEGLPPLDHSTIGRDLEKRNFDPHLKE